MSTSEIIQQLELCAQIMMTPGANVTVNDRSKAEEFFLNFQKTKTKPFELCREILETTQNQYVLFQVGACLKNAIIREWSTIGQQQSVALFNYLFEYINRRQLDQYVIEELMIVNAIIVKRISIAESNEENTNRDNNNLPAEATTCVSKVLISQLMQIIQGSTTNILIVLNACTAIKQILNEHCILNHNSDYALSWYQNLVAKKRFERLFLKDVFKSIIETLYRHMKLPEETRRTIEWIKLSGKLMRICEMILSWNFNSTFSTFFHLYSIATFGRDRSETPNFDPPINWMEFIIDGNLIQFFCEMYVTVRTLDPDLLHAALNCLTQLSTWSSTRQANGVSTMRKKFVESIMKNVISLCNMIIETVSIHEVLFLSNLINSTCINLRIHSTIQHCDFGLVRSFIDLLIKILCKTLLQSVKIKIESDEDEFDKCNRSIEQLINSVMIIVNLIPYVHDINQQMPQPIINITEFITMEELKLWCKPLFETYLRSHLSEPEGLLPLSCFQDDDEVQEFEEDDNTLYREQNIAIGCIAQVNLLDSINTITQLMIIKLQQFEQLIRTIDETPDKMLQWTRISEDIHWILMISIYMFTSPSENEIPREVVRVSIQASADIQATQQALENGDYTRTNIDPVVRYFIIILKLVQMEKQILENNMKQWISPQVSYTLTCFISRFMHVYLAPMEYDDDRYEISLSLNSCFGADSPNCKHIFNYFLDHLETKFLTMSSETKVLITSSEGLKTFCKFRERSKLLRECASLHRLLQRFPFDPSFRKLHFVRRNMYYVFTTVFATNHEIVIDPLIQIYKAFCEKLFIGYNEQLEEDFLMISDFVIGLSNVVNLYNFNNVWKKFLSIFYNDLPKVLKVMHKQSIVVQAILEILFNFSVFFCSLFQEEDNLAFYDNAVAILNEYAIHTKDTFTMDENRLQEIQEEFIWILKFLNDLSTQDIFILFTTPSPKTSTTSLTKTIEKVVLTSLNIIMPLINDRMLENDKLCILYYKLLDSIAQDFKGFPIKLFEKSVEYAFKTNNISTEIKTVGFKILYEILMQKDISPGSTNEDLKPFFKIIIDFIFCELVHSHDLVLRDAVAMALYSLVCRFKDTYRDIIKELMHWIGDPQIEQNVCNALFKMIDEIGLENRYDFAHRSGIKKSFADFIAYLQTLLR